MSKLGNLLSWFVIASLGGATGCVTFNDFMKSEKSQLDTSLLAQEGFSVPPGGMPTQVREQQMNDSSGIILEVRDGSRHLERIPLANGRPVFIEDIVREAQLAKRLGETRISIMRSNGPGRPPVRLDILVGKEGRVANLGQNYALRPGDHVIVNLTRKSTVEEFLETIGIN